tara:strand:+ start:187 stop:1494 length:1308 start_codon:yes stop_codon:yes gene_type:complete
LNAFKDLTFANVHKMKAIMNIENINTLEDLEHFIQGNQTVIHPILGDKHERYQFIQKTLVQFSYVTLNKADKGIVNRYIRKVSGYSRQQLTRLIKQYKDGGSIQWQPCRSNGFSTVYTMQDITLLAEMDTRHDDICGHAIKKLIERAYNIFGQQEYHTLTNISVSHLYNLRNSQEYQKQRKNFTKTQPRQIAIGKRRKPQSNGQPGFIRIDTVYQGDLDKDKGIYHINAIDEITQFEVVCSVEQISERYLIPVLEQMLSGFPFIIKEFYLDNGSEQINKDVCKLLTKLQLELPKSPSHLSSDKTLPQNKKASVVRELFSDQHLDQKWAPLMNEFNVKYLHPYINYHLPCFFSLITLNNKGKPIKTYPYESMMTPYEKLKSLPNAKSYLKSDVHFEKLDEQVMSMTDNACAELLQQERNKLFDQVFEHEGLSKAQN